MTTGTFLARGVSSLVVRDSGGSSFEKGASPICHRLNDVTNDRCKSECFNKRGRTCKHEHPHCHLEECPRCHAND